MRLHTRAAPERRVGWRPRARRTRHRSGPGYTEPYGSVCNTRIGGMQAREYDGASGPRIRHRCDPVPICTNLQTAPGRRKITGYPVQTPLTNAPRVDMQITAVDRHESLSMQKVAPAFGLALVFVLKCAPGQDLHAEQACT